MAKIPFIRHLKTHHVVGYDVVGTVVSVGDHENCAGFYAGDKVYGMAAGGSIAQYTTMLCSTASHAPKSLDDMKIAGLPVVALTSLEAFRRVEFKKGMRVLVVGASGGCGIFGVTIAKALGASHVAGICSEKNAKFVKATAAILTSDTRPKCPCSYRSVSSYLTFDLLLSLQRLTFSFLQE